MTVVCSVTQLRWLGWTQLHTWPVKHCMNLRCTSVPSTVSLVFYSTSDYMVCTMSVQRVEINGLRLLLELSQKGILFAPIRAHA